MTTGPRLVLSPKQNHMPTLTKPRLDNTLRVKSFILFIILFQTMILTTTFVLKQKISHTSRSQIRGYLLNIFSSSQQIRLKKVHFRSMIRLDRNWEWPLTTLVILYWFRPKTIDFKFKEKLNFAKVNDKRKYVKWLHLPKIEVSSH